MIGRAEGLALSRVQYDRFADVLDTLAPEEWALPTDCTEWSVKDVAAHVLGGLEAVRSPRELLRQVRLARRDRTRPFLDALNDVAVREKADVPGADVAARLRTVLPSALKGRARTPAPLRSLVKVRMDVAGVVSLGWILDVVYSRDTFLHRVDVCRATGRDIVLDATERRIVADVAEEWAGRHGAPVTLVLTGPAGGTYDFGGGEAIECDAVEFTRSVSGRGSADGLLKTPVQF